jgi:hypothetical protein
VEDTAEDPDEDGGGGRHRIDVRPLP